ncbi:MAG TPA: hypothetical protein VF450_22780 [Noviherbaspirillum sp.]
MVSIIDDNTIGLLNLALNATTMRHQAIAHNIANAGTPGYRPIDVSFEAQLVQARDAVASNPGRPLASLGNFQPTFELLPPNVLGDTSVSLDMEVAKLSENTLHHEALLKALNRHFSIIGSAINEGKR